MRLLVVLVLVAAVGAFAPLPIHRSTRLDLQSESANNSIRPIQHPRHDTLALHAAASFEAAAETGEKLTKFGRVKRAAKKTVASFNKTPILPVIIAFALGVRFGGRTAAVPRSAVSRLREYPIVFSLLLVTTARELWRAVPPWIKRSIGRSSTKDQAASAQTADPDDMTSLPAISLKLQSLFEVVDKKLVTPLDPVKQRAAFFTYLLLVAQVKKQRADQRDKRYDEAGKEADPSKVLDGMDQAFEFADWAYNEFPDQTETSLQERLEDLGFSLVRHDKTALPGRVAHYVAINPEKRVALISVKGSSNFEDLLTDVCGNAVSHELEAPFVNDGNTNITCHEGVYISSKRLFQDLVPLVEHMILPTGYKIIITGHSLGAGAAAMLGLFLRSRLPALRAKNRLEVLAFASPPILDLDSALACSSFTTTFVNNSDMIPRCSLYVLSILLEVLNNISERLKKKGMKPDEFTTVNALKRIMADGDEGEMVLSAEELADAIDEASSKIEERDPGHLYVPGKVVHMYDLWAKKGYGEQPSEATGEREADVRTAERVHVTYGTSKALRFIEADERILLDHLSPGYRSSIKALLSEQVV